MPARPLATLSLCAALAMAGSACESGDEPDDEVSVEEPRTIGIEALEAGACFDVPTEVPEDGSSVDVAEVRAVPCDEAHDNEVYATFDLDGDAYPGDDEVAARADEGCISGFEEFVGTPYEDSELDFIMLTPTPESWEERDHRTVVCAVYDFAGDQLTGTAGSTER